MQNKYSTTTSGVVNKLYIPLLAISLSCFAAANYYFFVDMALSDTSKINDLLSNLILTLLSMAALASFFVVGIGRLFIKKYSLGGYVVVTIFYIILSALGATSLLYDFELIKEPESVQKTFFMSLLALAAIELVMSKGGANNG